MKNLIKGLVVALILNVSVVLAQSNVKVSVDFPGTAKGSGDLNGSFDSKMGFAIGGEFMKPMSNNFAVGGGFNISYPAE